MYAFFTLIAGACQSAMASLNGMLSDCVGMFGMSLMVHAIGGILLVLYIKLFVHEKLKLTGMPWYLYSAGFFGIFHDLHLCHRTACHFCSHRPLWLVRRSPDSF